MTTGRINQVTLLSTLKHREYSAYQITRINALRAGKHGRASTTRTSDRVHGSAFTQSAPKGTWGPKIEWNKSTKSNCKISRVAKLFLWFHCSFTASLTVWSCFVHDLATRLLVYSLPGSR